MVLSGLLRCQLHRIPLDRFSLACLFELLILFLDGKAIQKVVLLTMKSVSTPEGFEAAERAVEIGCIKSSIQTKKVHCASHILIHLIPKLWLRYFSVMFMLISPLFLVCICRIPFTLKLGIEGQLSERQKNN